MRASARLPLGSLSPLEAEGLPSQYDILRDTTLVVPGESASVFAGESLCHLVHWPLFLCQPRDPVKFQQGTWGAS